MKTLILCALALTALTHNAHAEQPCVIYDDSFQVTTKEVRAILKSKGYIVTQRFPLNQEYFSIDNRWDMAQTPLSVFRCLSTNMHNSVYKTQLTLSHSSNRFTPLDRGTRTHFECYGASAYENEKKRAKDLKLAAQDLLTCAENVETLKNN